MSPPRSSLLNLVLHMTELNACFVTFLFMIGRIRTKCHFSIIQSHELQFPIRTNLMIIFVLNLRNLS